jgi:hypothetical protein
MGVDPADSGIVQGTAPYLRVAYQKDYETQNFEVGAFGLFPDVYPGSDKSTGTTDRYSDLGLNASYEFTGDGNNIYTVNARLRMRTRIWRRHSRWAERRPRTTTSTICASMPHTIGRTRSAAASAPSTR